MQSFQSAQALQKTQIIQASQTNQIISTDVLAQAQQQLKTTGWALLRGFEHDVEKFSELVHGFCRKLTFDPAREFTNNSTQKVDAGIEAIGLHIENGNTPFPPDLVAFYSRKSAKTGSQTTLCDGTQLYDAMPERIKQLFNSPMVVSRNLPEHLWKNYVANEHPQLNDAAQVTPQHLQELMDMLPGQTGEINEAGDLHYRLGLSPVLNDSGKLSFANAILGPSFNYDAPCYEFEDGSVLKEALKQEIAELAEPFTLELNWHDGDMILIDNRRVMHGRRAIEGDPNARQLVIAMGSH